MAFVGRENELRELESRYHSDRNELIAVYGRWRVGKTALIDKAFNHHFFFRHVGVSPKRMAESKKRKLDIQLEAFALSCRLYFGHPIKRPKSWLEAFTILIEQIRAAEKSLRKVIFIDEMPWMDTPRSSFLESFGWFVNHVMETDDNLLIVVAGSSTSWMSDNIVSETGGLYDRATYRLHLLPFQLRESELLLKANGMDDFSREQTTLAYMSVGGIPFHLNQFDKNLSFRENIDAMFFGKSPRLDHEFETLFSSMFDSSKLCESIVRVLSGSTRGMGRAELIQSIGYIDNGQFSNALKALEAGSFVLRFIPYGLSSKDPYYKLIDPFCLFYLREVEGRKSLNEKVFEDEVSQGEENEWKGRAFENVVFSHLNQVKTALGISGIETMQCSWMAEEKMGRSQIDLVIERKDGIINLCEMKFRARPFAVDFQYHCLLQHRKEAFLEQSKGKYTVALVLITTHGLSKGQYADDFRKVITLDSLFTPCP